jgi:hypothetical protein
MNERARPADNLTLVKRAIAFHAKEIERAAAEGDLEQARLHRNLVTSLLEQQQRMQRK